MTSATHEKAPGDPAGVAGRVVMVVAVGTAVVMGLGVVVAWQLESAGTERVDLDRTSARFGAPPADMNGIEMSLIAAGSDAARGRITHGSPPAAAAAGSRAAEQRLKEYGWVDRERGRVHIPIERALELYLAQEGAMGNRAAPGRAGTKPAGDAARSGPRSPSSESGGKP
jgi:hypothetical protein